MPFAQSERSGRAAEPGAKELSIAHWGQGTLAHLAAAELQGRVGVKLLEVPYKGIAPIATAVGGGEVDLAFVPLAGPILGMIQTGARIRTLVQACVWALTRAIDWSPELTCGV